MWLIRASGRIAPSSYSRVKIHANLSKISRYRSFSVAPCRATTRLGTKDLVLETGKVAMLANSSVMGSYGETVVLTTVVADRGAPDVTGFLPLTVDYRVKAHASGKIPRSRDRRDGAATDSEVLTSRAIDRVLRPLFPSSYVYNTQIVSTLHASDGVSDPVTAAINSASAALMLSDIPWNGPAGCVRVGRVNGEFVLGPDVSDLSAAGSLDLLYAATETRTLMVELNGNEISEKDTLEAMRFAHKVIRALLRAQRGLVESAGKEIKMSEEATEDMLAKAHEVCYDKAYAAFTNSDLSKEARGRAEGALIGTGSNLLAQEYSTVPEWLRATAIDKVMRTAMRDAVLATGVRCDGRGVKDIRPLSAEVDMLPIVHGSSVFTRGQTQALCTVTLGPNLTAGTARYIGSTKLQERQEREAMGPSVHLHYDFPPYCVNEIGRIAGVNRRMVGHGNLAEKAILAVMPNKKVFPYMTRITTEVTMSNGSSSMASACGASLALMDAGVPIRAPVAGISVGMVSRPGADSGPGSSSVGEYALLTDILGTEDHFGDMDFKVAGTKKGITAIQLDVKLEGGVPLEILEEAVYRAKEGRERILEVMDDCLSTPRAHLKRTAPLIEVVHFKKERLLDIKGIGGETLRGIEEKYDVNIDLTVEGQASVFSEDPEQAKEVKRILQELSGEVMVGDTFEGTVTSVKDFGVHVEVLRGRQGVLHMSEVSHHLGSKTMEELFKVGQIVQVKCTDVDAIRGIVKFSRKVLLARDERDELLDGNRINEEKRREKKRQRQPEQQISKEDHALSADAEIDEITEHIPTEQHVHETETILASSTTHAHKEAKVVHTIKAGGSRVRARVSKISSQKRASSADSRRDQLKVTRRTQRRPRSEIREMKKALFQKNNVHEDGLPSEESESIPAEVEPSTGTEVLVSSKQEDSGAINSRKLQRAQQQKKMEADHRAREGNWIKAQQQEKMRALHRAREGSSAGGGGGGAQNTMSMHMHAVDKKKQNTSLFVEALAQFAEVGVSVDDQLIKAVNGAGGREINGKSHKKMNGYGYEVDEMSPNLQSFLDSTKAGSDNLSAEFDALFQGEEELSATETFLEEHSLKERLPEEHIETFYEDRAVVAESFSEEHSSTESSPEEHSFAMESSSEEHSFTESSSEGNSFATESLPEERSSEGSFFAEQPSTELSQAQSGQEAVEHSKSAEIPQQDVFEKLTHVQVHSAQTPTHTTTNANIIDEKEVGKAHVDENRVFELSKLTKVELKARVKALQLPVSGNKSDLIARLVAYEDKQNAEAS